MAKSKLLKAKKRAKARARKSVERQDYRQGGRVAFQRGGPRGKEPVERDTKEPSEQDIRDTRTSGSFSVSRNQQTRPQPTSPQPVVMEQPGTVEQPVTEAPVMPSQPTSQPTQQPVTMESTTQQPFAVTQETEQPTAPEDEETTKYTDPVYSDDYVLDSEGNQVLDENGNPQPRWVKDEDGNWQPTQAMLDQEATYGRTWDVEKRDWVDVETGKTQLVNPLLEGSELGRWVAENDEHKLYTIDGDPNSGYLMKIWWVTADGQIGSTDEGWSRVPKENRLRVYRTQDEATAAIAEYDTYKADLQIQRDADYIESTKEGIGGAATTPERRERIERAATAIEAAREGKIFDKDGNEVDLSIPDAVKAGDVYRDENGNPILDEENNPIPIVRDQDASASEIAAGLREKVTATQAGGFVRNEDGSVALDGDGNPIPVIAEEEVTTVDPSTLDKASVAGLDKMEAATYDAATIETAAKVEAAEGEVGEDSLAKAAKVDRVPKIDAAEVEIEEGALTDRVIGTISEGAKAIAVKNAGSDLRKITRAKKQLKRAGLTDEQINEIGNDPEALEDRLADFSEAERGIIEGLPEEALMSTQMSGLLEGIENGEIPTWASPAVAQVEQMLAQRGLSASTVGRDNLFNAIIQSAMPIAQSNAQAIQQAVAQQRDIEAKESEANAQRAQQVGLTNAQNVFNMDMAQFSSDQQIALSNSKFLQTVSLTNASNKQQAALQDAILMSQANLAEADFYQKAQIQNAQAFLQTDLTNLSNEQQANVLNAQQEQQRLLSNQAANNAAKQFNAASQNQIEQFAKGLQGQISQFNAAQKNATLQFNATQSNAAEARRTAREADLAKFNAQLVTQTDQFNSQQEFQRLQWNAQNAAAVEASNIQWRRQTNLANTSTQNAINQQNAQNAFNLSSQAQAFLWQELRDQADFDFRAVENEENRKAQIIATALANEGEAGEKYDDYLATLLNSISTSYRAGLGG